jgi:hypothetical protein
MRSDVGKRRRLSFFLKAIIGALIYVNLLNEALEERRYSSLVLIEGRTASRSRGSYFFLRLRVDRGSIGDTARVLGGDLGRRLSIRDIYTLRFGYS